MMSTSCLRRARSPMWSVIAHVMPGGTPPGVPGDKGGTPSGVPGDKRGTPPGVPGDRRGFLCAQVLAVMAAAVLTAGSAAAQGGPACDRECLIGVAEQYLDA